MGPTKQEHPREGLSSHLGAHPNSRQTYGKASPGLVPPPPPPHYPPGWVVRQLPRGKPAARAHVGFDLASGRVQTFRAAPGPKRGSARKRYTHGRRA